MEKVKLLFINVVMVVTEQIFLAFLLLNFQKVK